MAPEAKAPGKRFKKQLEYDTIAWIVLSAIILYYSDIVNAIKVDSRINGYFFTSAVIFSCLSCTVALYYIIWCSMVKGINSDDWESYAPYGIPLATASGVLSGISWIIALWPVYGIKTPLIVFCLFMGFVMTISVLPSWSVGQTSATKTPRSTANKED